MTQSYTNHIDTQNASILINTFSPHKFIIIAYHLRFICRQLNLNMTYF